MHFVCVSHGHRLVEKRSLDTLEVGYRDNCESPYESLEPSLRPLQELSPQSWVDTPLNYQNKKK